jgi:hypothetical protein
VVESGGLLNRYRCQSLSGVRIPPSPLNTIVFGTKVACVAAISGNSLSIGKRDFDLGHASSLRSGLARPPKTTLLPPGLPSLA